MVFASNRERTLLSAFSQSFGIYDLGSGKEVENDDKQFYDPPIEDFNIPYEHGKSALPNKPTFLPIRTESVETNLIFTAHHQCPILRKRMTKNF